MTFEGALVDSLNDAVVVADLDGRIVYANAAVEEMLGWPVESIVGMPLPSLVPARLRAAHEAGFARFAGGGAPRIIGTPLRLPAHRADGSEIPIELVLSTMRSGGSQLVVGTLRDVSGRVDLERETALVHQILSIITDADESISTTEELAGQLLSGVATELGCQVAALWVPAEDGALLEPLAVWADASLERSAMAAETRTRKLAKGRGLPGRVWSTGVPEWVSDLSADELFTRPGAAAGDGLTSGFAFPLTANGKPFGVVELFQREQAEPDPPLLAALEQLAPKLGTWLWRTRLERENRAMADREHAVADALRMSLLPPVMPRVAGLELAGRFHPAGDVIVGGDFYDAFVLDGANDAGGALGVAIGDVCGNGPVAAATTAHVRYTLRALASPDAEPADVLRRVNDALLRRDDPDPRFCTAVFGIVTRDDDGDGARVALSCAGHPPPIVRRRDGSVEAIACRGTLLGIVPAGRWTTVEIRLSPGDCLLLYTDGVTEAHRRGGDEFGEARLLQLVSAEGGGTPEDLVAALERAAVEHGGGASDDIASLAILCRAD